MRREKNSIKAIAVAMAFLMRVPLGAQEFNIQIVEEIDLVQMESAAEFLENLRQAPLWINVASREVLERAMILSQFQIVSILDYREKFGSILSFSELSLVHGFTESIVEELRPYLRLETDIRVARNYWKNKVVFKYKRDFFHRSEYDNVDFDTFLKRPNSYYLGSPDKLLLKYRGGSPLRLETGFTLEKDPGEILISWGNPTLKTLREHGLLHGNSGGTPDFSSGFLTYHFRRIKLFVGDFSARFGQGLVLWNSFSISAMGSPSSILKRDHRLTPYTSTNESDFLRGVGAVYEKDRTTISLFVSYNSLDARVDNTRYYSLPSGDIHATVSTLNTRKTLREMVSGFNTSYSFPFLKIGVTGTIYSYNRINGLEIKEYNKYQIYDGWWGNLSMDYYMVFGRFRLFGEVGVDAGLSPAYLTGILWTPSNTFETSFIWRDYSPSYIATHAGAITSGSSCSNEFGPLFQVRYLPHKRLEIAGCFEYLYYPWLKYRIDSPSDRLRIRGSVDHKLSDRIILKLNIGYVNKSTWADPAKLRNKSFSEYLNSNISLKWHSSQDLFLESKAYITMQPFGYAIFQEAGIKRPSFEIALRATYHNTPSWDSRIYVYERDTPTSFSVPALYGQGFTWYIYAKYKLGKSITMNIKLRYPRSLSMEILVSRPV